MTTASPQRPPASADQVASRLSSSFDSIRRVGSMAVARRITQQRMASKLRGAIVWMLLYVYDAKAALRSITRLLARTTRG